MKVTQIMATHILKDKFCDMTDAFALEALGIKSLSCVLEDLILERMDKHCTLGLSDPDHPVQQMHALIVAIRRQVEFSETVVNALLDEGGAA
jgi:hypothetical protein